MYFFSPVSWQHCDNAIRSTINPTGIHFYFFLSLILSFLTANNINWFIVKKCHVCWWTVYFSPAVTTLKLPFACNYKTLINSHRTTRPRQAQSQATASEWNVIKEASLREVSNVSSRRIVESSILDSGVWLCFSIDDDDYKNEIIELKRDTYVFFRFQNVAVAVVAGHFGCWQQGRCNIWLLIVFDGS